MFIAAIRSAATYLAVSLYVLIVAPLAMLVALVFRWKGILYVGGHVGVRLGLLLSGIRVRVTGRQHLPREAAVFCANHQSNVDPPVLFAVIHPRMHILYKHEIDRIPVLARAFRMGGFVPIDRSKKEAAMRAVEGAARSIRSGNSFLIFPEGTRSRTDDLLPFKKGGFIMAIKAGAPIVPVAIQGGRDAMHPGSWLIRPVTLSVRVGAPIETAGYAVEERDRLIDVVRSRLAALLAEGAVATAAD